MRHPGTAVCLLAALGLFAPVVATATPPRARRPAPGPSCRHHGARACAATDPRAVIFDTITNQPPRPVALEVEGMSVQVQVAPQKPCPNAGILMAAEGSAPPEPESACTVATLEVQAPGHPIFRQAIASLIVGEDGGALGTLNLFVYQLDRHGGPLEVLLSGYTMGAHCCMVSAIVGLDGAGQWRVTPLPSQDGDALPAVLDINHDGGRQFVLGDQQFNYVFASYAWSVLPVVVYDYASGVLRNVTTQPAYAPFLRAGFRRDFPAFRAPPPPERKDINGFLAAYVANSANLGQLRSGWMYMRHWYDRRADSGQTWCALDPSVKVRGVEGCPAPYVRKVPYPQALALFLLQTGYITHAQCVALGYDPEKIQRAQAAVQATTTARWRAAHPG